MAASHLATRLIKASKGSFLRSVEIYTPSKASFFLSSGRAGLLQPSHVGPLQRQTRLPSQASQAFNWQGRGLARLGVFGHFGRAGGRDPQEGAKKRRGHLDLRKGGRGARGQAAAEAERRKSSRPLAALALGCWGVSAVGCCPHDLAGFGSTVGCWLFQAGAQGVACGARWGRR